MYLHRGGVCRSLHLPGLRSVQSGPKDRRGGPELLQSVQGSVHRRDQVSVQTNHIINVLTDSLLLTGVELHTAQYSTDRRLCHHFVPFSCLIITASAASCQIYSLRILYILLNLLKG